MEQPPILAPELQPLDFLTGLWHSTGEVKATSSSPAIKIKGTDSYEWVAGRCFLLHRVDVHMGDEQIEVIEIIGGYNDSTGIYLMRSFDNQSKFTIMQASIDPDGVLKITGDGVRSALRHDQSSRYMQALWERSEDGKTWIPWMEMQFTKF